jgi:glycosyltransferase involved in cell wall biosynthesis
MRLCMISGLAKYAGGIENVVSELSNFMVNHGAKVTVFGRYDRDFVESSGNYTTIGVRPYDLLPPVLRFVQYDKYVYNLKVWRKAKFYGPFDIIHGHGDNCFFSSLFGNQRPFVMTFHQTMKGYIRRIFGSRISPRLFPLFYPEIVAAARCDSIIACSKAVKDELVSLYGINSSKVQVIYNGVDTINFRPFDKKRARRMLGLPENKKYGIWVGTNPEPKRLSTAVKSVKGLKDTYLLVVGISDAQYENIISFGRIQDKQLMCILYNAADFLIFPTLYEGFGLVTLEAMACGLPVIISKECPAREIIQEGTHGFVIRDDEPLSYKAKIESLLDNNSEIEDMSVQCRSLALQYSWKKQAEKYWKIYKRSLELF